MAVGIILSKSLKQNNIHLYATTVIILMTDKMFTVTFEAHFFEETLKQHLGHLLLKCTVRLSDVPGTFRCACYSCVP